MPQLATIKTALQAIRAGKPVIVADDENRENEGDVILSAALATPEWIAWTVRWSSGLLCAPMSNEIADQLELPMMVARNEDIRGTAYTVTVDATHGITTGISASDRTKTVRTLAAPNAKPGDVRRPGHILPLRAVDGGVRARGGHTEAGVELMRLAKLPAVAVIAEIVAENGEMMRLPQLLKLGQKENIPVITIEQLITHLEKQDTDTPTSTTNTKTENNSGCATRHPHRSVSRRADTLLPTRHGPFRAQAYRDRRAGIDHIALIAQTSENAHPTNNTLVRVHSECLTGEAFGSLKCECGPQLQDALALVSREGGIVIYLRGQEGRGIGLANKLRAYQLQETGIDTLDANLQLGLPADARDYTAAAEILQELGIDTIRLITNNPDKIASLEAHGIKISERIPLISEKTPENEEYLRTKRERFGHKLP